MGSLKNILLTLSVVCLISTPNGTSIKEGRLEGIDIKIEYGILDFGVVELSIIGMKIKNNEKMTDIKNLCEKKNIYVEQIVFMIADINSHIFRPSQYAG